MVSKTSETNFRYWSGRSFPGLHSKTLSSGEQAVLAYMTVPSLATLNIGFGFSCGNLAKSSSRWLALAELAGCPFLLGLFASPFTRNHTEPLMPESSGLHFGQGYT